MRHVVRLFGVAILIWLLTRLEWERSMSYLRNVQTLPLMVALVLYPFMLLIKVERWRRLLVPQQLFYRLRDASLAYSASIFLGLFTPGRLGEVAKASYVMRDLNTSFARAFPSVVFDRVFDFFVLTVVGSAALAVRPEGAAALWIVVTALVLSLAFGAFLHPATWRAIDRLAMRVGGRFAKLVNGRLPQTFRSTLTLYKRGNLFTGLALTVLAYGIFFLQCYLLAVALRIDISFAAAACAVALGSLVTLLPISISGIGTRDAAIVAYLGTWGVAAEPAFSYSALIFLVFYVGGAIMGAAALLAKPITLTREDH